MTNLFSLQEYVVSYAFDILGNKAEFEQELIKSTDLQAELAFLQAVVSYLAYGAPIVPLPIGLTNKLFLPQRLLRRLDRTDARPADLLELIEWSVADLRQVAMDLSNWEPFPMPTGSMRVIWQVDEIHAQIAFFLKIPGAGTLPHHWHATGESILVLEGNFINDSGTVFEVGDRIVVAANTNHQPTTSLGCLILGITSMYDKVLAAKI